MAAHDQPQYWNLRGRLGGGGAERRLRRDRAQPGLSRPFDFQHHGPVRLERNAPVESGLLRGLLPFGCAALDRRGGQRLRGLERDRNRLLRTEVQPFRCLALVAAGHDRRRLLHRLLAGAQPRRDRCGGDGEHLGWRDLGHGRLQCHDGRPQMASGSRRGHRRQGRRGGRHARVRDRPGCDRRGHPRARVLPHRGRL